MTLTSVRGQECAGFAAWRLVQGLRGTVCSKGKGAMLLASMLIAQVVISASAPPLSPAEAARVLRASRSTADLTDLAAPELPLPSVRVPWRPGDGPFGPFDQRLTQLDFRQRGSAPWIYGSYDPWGRLHASGRPRIYREFTGLRSAARPPRRTRSAPRPSS